MNKVAALICLFSIALSGCSSSTGDGGIDSGVIISITCDPGKYPDGINCVKAPKGSYSDGKKLFACGVGTYADTEGLSECISCSNKPTDAVDVTYSTAIDRSSPNCPVAQVDSCTNSKHPYNTACVSCANAAPTFALAYVLDSAAVNVAGGVCRVTSITQCEPGRYPDGQLCTAAPAGSVSDGFSVSLCPAGQFTDAIEQTACQTCSNLPANAVSVTYLPGSTSAVCSIDTVDQCDVGYFRDGAVCTQAIAGYIADGYTQEICLAGTYQDMNGQTSCNTCSNKPSGSVSVTYAQATTPNSSSCPIASVDSCDSGKYISGLTCVDAEAGSSANGITKTACPADTYQSQAGQSSCTPCTNKGLGEDVVTYVSATGQTAQCEVDTVVSCLPGYSLSGGACVPLPAPPTISEIIPSSSALPTIVIPGTDFGKVTLFHTNNESGATVEMAMTADDSSPDSSVSTWTDITANFVSGTPITIDSGMSGNFVRVRSSKDGVHSQSVITYDLKKAAKQVSVGQNHACMLTVNGEVYCWGNNTNSQLGTGNQVSSVTPVKVLNITDARSLVSNADQNCVIRASGAVLCWGGLGTEFYNSTRGMAINSTTAVSTPSVTTLPNMKSISLGTEHGCGIRASDEMAICWGWDGRGQLGDGVSDTSSPSPVSTGVVASIISSNSDNSCLARKSDGVIMCWGENRYKNVGANINPINASTYFVRTATALPGITGSAVSLSVGFNHTCASTFSGTYRNYCWGTDSAGEGMQSGGGEVNSPVLYSGTPYSHVLSGSGGTLAFNWNGVSADWVDHFGANPMTKGAIAWVNYAPARSDYSFKFYSLDYTGQSVCVIDNMSKTRCAGYGGINGSQDAIDNHISTLSPVGVYEH